MAGFVPGKTTNDVFCLTPTSAEILCKACRPRGSRSGGGGGGGGGRVSHYIEPAAGGWVEGHGIDDALRGRRAHRAGRGRSLDTQKAVGER